MRTVQQHRKQLSSLSDAGFTLIELSIVLIIIALIIASILVGQDLIRAAEVRAVVTQYEQFNAAVGAFRTKYGKIPGDANNAVSLGLGGADGNGDGLIDDGSANLNQAAAGEVTDFWQHLSTAALVSGTFDGAEGAAAVVGDTFPRLKTGTGGWTVYAGRVGAASDGRNYFHLGVTGADATDITFTDVFSPLDAFNIDSKIDDGNPAGGIVTPRDGLSDGTSYDGIGAAVAGATNCIDTTTTYNLDNLTALCQVRVRMVY